MAIAKIFFLVSISMSQTVRIGLSPGKACLITVSLSMPWRPDGWEGDDPCWKLIAGVIELEEDIIY